jgi:hypothetical protein
LINFIALLLGAGAAATASNSAARAFPRPSVCACPLAVGGQTPTVAEATVGANFDQAADILVNLPPQVAFSQVFPVHQLTDPVNLSFGKLIHPRRHVRVNVGLDQDFISD